jgi:hypothetical protein
MGYWKVEVEDNKQLGRVLIVEGEAHNGEVYVARIVGTDPRYRYARQFIGAKKNYWAKDVAKSVIRVTVSTTELRDGDLLEIRVSSLNRSENRRFCVWESGGIRWISEEELKVLLESKGNNEEDQVGGTKEVDQAKDTKEVEIRGNEQFKRWVEENGVEYFENDEYHTSFGYKGYTAVDKNGQCYLITLREPEAKYYILKVDWFDALCSLKNTEHMWDFKRLLRSRRKKVAGEEGYPTSCSASPGMF